MAKIDSAYAYYLSNYGNKEASRYDSHKKSDLKKLYSKMVKVNKDSPLYKLSDPSNAKKYAIDIKESTRDIQNVVASLSSDDGINSSFQKKVAVSSDEDIVEALYIGNSPNTDDFDEFSMEISSLASPQINMGNFLRKDSLSMIPGTYSFDLSTVSASYEFQFTVKKGENNLDVQRKLASLITNSGIGLKAQIVNNDNNPDENSISITSNKTGLAHGEHYQFQISPESSNNSINVMNIIGINKVSQQASNSNFTLNGIAHSSYSNTFTVNNSIELKIKQTTDGSAVTIGYKKNLDAIADNISDLTKAYNNVLTLAENFSKIPTQHTSNRFLLNDVSGVALSRKSSLENIGLIVGENGHVELDKNILENAISPDNVTDTFKLLNEFKNAMGAKADEASLNPMNYMDKVIVEYKKPHNNFPTPYISSIYSGMMLDDFA